MHMTFRQSSEQVRLSSLPNNFTIVWIKYQKANLNIPVFAKTMGQQAMVQSGRPPITVNDMLLTLLRWLTHIYLLSVVVSFCNNIVECVWPRQTAYEYCPCGLLRNKKLPLVENSHPRGSASYGVTLKRTEGCLVPASFPSLWYFCYQFY